MPWCPCHHPAVLHYPTKDREITAVRRCRNHCHITIERNRREKYYFTAAIAKRRDFTAENEEIAQKKYREEKSLDKRMPYCISTFVDFSSLFFFSAISAISAVK